MAFDNRLHICILGYGYGHEFAMEMRDCGLVNQCIMIWSYVVLYANEVTKITIENNKEDKNVKGVLYYGGLAFKLYN